ncbi:TYRO protein tyrosine kinase-binding protein-like isoform X2 [Scyliorhinus torazame]|uniref:TYRO protein tyrosine kinase-binding protein-like isoform X2 n=1 Tax=Scyliorhinus torazame TaxID=75743 RepID=UPI003B593439
MMQMFGHPTVLTLSLFLFSLLLGAANGQNGCEDCYRIDGGVIAGIIIGDVIITIMIAMTIYYFARRGVNNAKNAKKLQISDNKSKLEPESPYEELQGQDRGFYSELRLNRK